MAKAPTMKAFEKIYPLLVTGRWFKTSELARESEVTHGTALNWLHLFEDMNMLERYRSAYRFKKEFRKS